MHAVTDRNGQLLSFFMTAGPISDYTGAAALLDSLPAAEWLLADRSYDTDWFKDGLEEKGVRPCIPGLRSRTTPMSYNKRKYWHRVATRYDRCPTGFFSAVCLAATVIFWYES
ncbi:Mobile element protein [Asaia bogorensis]|uniref:Mobile element protein n=1 Tax=Asaia bogorensis TaxID=91915 RepID=A0A060QCM8_9PROT|nr:Mobile element protein [Asaia bogorensis]